MLRHCSLFRFSFGISRVCARPGVRCSTGLGGTRSNGYAPPAHPQRNGALRRGRWGVLSGGTRCFLQRVPSSVASTATASYSASNQLFKLFRLAYWLTTVHGTVVSKTLDLQASPSILRWGKQRIMAVRVRLSCHPEERSDEGSHAVRRIFTRQNSYLFTRRSALHVPQGRFTLAANGSQCFTAQPLHLRR